VVAGVNAEAGVWVKAKAKIKVKLVVKAVDKAVPVRGEWPLDWAVNVSAQSAGIRSPMSAVSPAYK
jgi:hypothetical protein